MELNGLYNDFQDGVGFFEKDIGNPCLLLGLENPWM